MIITNQACLDLDHKRKMTIHDFVTKIFHLTQGYVIKECILLTDLLPKTNITYVIASVLLFIAKLPNDYFLMTFKQKQAPVRQYIRNEELDSDVRIAKVDLHLTLPSEETDNPPSAKEIEFVYLILAWVLKFIFPALIDTIKGADPW